MEWRLRSASESDRDFLHELHRITMYDVIDNTWGWDDAWQRADFDRRFGTCVVSIIDIQGRAVGGLWLESSPDSLHIVELQIVPEIQGKGIGRAVVRHVIQQGIDRGLPVTLSVVPANPRAQRLYERLGFEVTGVDAPFIHMRHGIRAAG
jgi:ribosomal protein S18 acetylase RimI-like enzyme